MPDLEDYIDYRLENFLDLLIQEQELCLDKLAIRQSTIWLDQFLGDPKTKNTIREVNAETDRDTYKDNRKEDRCM